MTAIYKLAAAMAEALRPDPERTVAQWADVCRELDPATTPEPGRWRTSRVPYTREPMEALSPGSPVERVVFMAGAQSAKTEIGLNFIAHSIDDSPGPALIVQPRDTDAETFSKMRLQRMIAACPSLREKVRDVTRDASNTITFKEFPGGILRLAGANAPAGLRSMPIRRLFFDEVDAAPLDCGGEGDPVALAVNRTNTFATRKVYLCSTPTVAGVSRIAEEFERGDRRRYHVPCPHCHGMQVLKWAQVKWPDGVPRAAWYECEHCGGKIESRHKDWMLPRGKWIAENPDAPPTVRSYHISALYAPHGWLSWGAIAEEFLHAKGDPNQLKTWVNTKLGEPWQAESGESLAVDAIMGQRAGWGDKVPAGVFVLTAGVDVQDDRLEVEIVGWGAGEESWSLEYHVLQGDPEGAAVWSALDNVLDAVRAHATGGGLRVACACVDSAGHRTVAVYDYVRARRTRQVWAVVGREGARPVWNNRPRKNNKGRVPLFVVGVDSAKESIYGRLRLTQAGPGFCHFPPDREEVYFKGLTCERFKREYRRGKMRLHWTKPEGARNEPLDCRVYAFAALRGWQSLGWKLTPNSLDRLRIAKDDPPRRAATASAGTERQSPPAPSPRAAPAVDPPPPKRRKPGWFSGGGAKAGWFNVR